MKEGKTEVTMNDDSSGAEMTGRGANWYDPFLDAIARGIRVCQVQLDSADSVWLPSLRVIGVAERLGPVTARYVVAHQLIHSELDEQVESGLARFKDVEAVANRATARRLLPERVLHAALATSDDSEQIADVLGVPLLTLRHRIEDLTARERDRLGVLASRIHWWPIGAHQCARVDSAEELAVDAGGWSPLRSHHFDIDLDRVAGTLRGFA